MATPLTPFVYWGQKSDILSLKIDLRNVENVEVSLTDEALDFSAQGLGVKGHNKYCFHLDFYLPVNPEESRYRTTDIAVEFQIKKTADEIWPRLTSERLKLHWLKIDFDKFPVDDSEEDSDISSSEQSSEALLNQFKKELGDDSSKTENKVDYKLNYLFSYNLFQFVGFTFIFVRLIYLLIKDGESSLQGAYESVGSQFTVCQIIACLEVLHPIVGLTKSNVLTALSQVVGRNFVLFGLVMQEPRLQISPVCWYLFIVWSAVEVIRYPYYLLQLYDMRLQTLTWLRYSVWIPLYPLGILIEATVVIKSISYFAETGFFSISMPNSANLAFYFPYFLALVLIVQAVGATNNLSYMWSQRQKQLSGKRRTAPKAKSS